jgi:hypothetical protein
LALGLVPGSAQVSFQRTGGSVIMSFPALFSTCGSKESDPPFPVSVPEKAGAGGSPQSPKSAAPPTRGLRYLVNPSQDFQREWLTGASLLMEAATVKEGAVA